MRKKPTPSNRSRSFKRIEGELLACDAEGGVVTVRMANGRKSKFLREGLSARGASDVHYGGNANTYMDVGDGFGRAMAKLLGSK